MHEDISKVKIYQPFVNQVGVALEGLGLASKCFSTNGGDVHIFLKVYSDGSIAILHGNTDKPMSEYKFYSLSDFESRSHILGEYQLVVSTLVSGCNKAETVCNQCGLDIPKEYRLETRSNNLGRFMYEVS